MGTVKEGEEASGKARTLAEALPWALGEQLYTSRLHLQNRDVTFTLFPPRTALMAHKSR